MELKTLDWTIEPLQVHRAISCFFADKARFPEGSVELDCALLMRYIAPEWHSRPDLKLSEDKTFLTALHA